jgi:lipoate-protein ligase A
MSRLRVIESVSNDPWFNLALEERLLRSIEKDTVVLYLWRNAPTVVIGRHQNPWVECRLDAMDAEGVKLSRRASGGGAVYHDLGNSNFTFVCRRSDYSVPRQIGVVVDALKRLEIDARFAGRNDILVGDRKVSGSAFFGTGDRWLHHGTLLLHADLGRLAHYLTVSPAKIESKAVASVRARVANLREFAPDLDHAAAGGALVEAFAEEYGRGFSIERLDPESLTGEDPELVRLYDRYRDETWRYGRTPRFTHQLERRFDWGGVELHLEVADGTIREAAIFTDALSLDLVDALVGAIEGTAYRRADVAARIEATEGAHPEHGSAARDVAAWLAESLPSAG